MAQQTQLSAMATPGRVQSFSAKTEAVDTDYVLTGDVEMRFTATDDVEMRFTATDDSEL